MKFRDLKDQLPALRQRGPVNVEFVKDAMDYAEAYPEGGMRATVLDITTDDEDVLRLHLSFEAFDEYNKAFESHNYFDRDGQPTLTARDAGYYSVKDHVYVMAGDDISTYFTLMGTSASKLHQQYLDECGDKGITYVQWLEAKVLDR